LRVGARRMNAFEGSGAPGAGPQEEPAISVVIPTKNRLTLLRRQIDAVLSQPFDRQLEIVVVDNGSDDETLTALTEMSQVDRRIRVVSATDMSDAAYARNVGAEMARAARLAFVDDDDIVGANWLQEIYSALDHYPLVAPRIDYDLLNSPQVTDGWPKTQATGLLPRDGLLISTGHVGIRSDLWRRLGGQRTGMITGEDADLSHRAARDLGIQPFYAASAVYHRLLPTTLRGSFRQGRRDGRGAVQRAVLDEKRRIHQRSSLVGALSAYWWLISRSPLALVGRRRFLWVMLLGDRVGRLEQCIRMRAVLP
jgi:glycosyltransferase involved in cell wall biosynthesis